MRFKNSIIPAVVVAASAALLLTACSKDKFTTRPQLKFLEAKSYDVPFGDIMEFYIEVTDKEGDISDSLFMMDSKASCPLSDFKEPVYFRIPPIVPIRNLKGEIVVSFSNGQLREGYPTYSPQCEDKNDTTTFKFWIKDLDGNVSDTVVMDKPIIIRR